jgi:3-isopropylmalate dehydrogenase
VERALAGGARTADIAEPGRKPGSTQDMGDAVLEALQANA